MQGTIQLNNWLEIARQDKPAHSFVIMTQETNHVFACASFDEQEEWINVSSSMSRCLWWRSHVCIAVL